VCSSDLFLIDNKVEMRLSKPLMKSQDANTESVSKIPTCFSDTYSADTPTASMRKLAPVARAAQTAGYVTLQDPGLVDLDKLRSLHDPDYVWAFITGEGRLASSQGWDWTPQIRNGVLAINAGQIETADMAFKHGIAANVAQGFHHSFPEHGAGFCTFNGLALVAQEFPEKRIFVLDCDEHCGDGTAEFTKKLPNIFNFSINGTNWGMHESERSICRNIKTTPNSFRDYKKALLDGFNCAREWSADLIIYQAGADPHVDDPMSTGILNTEQMLERDRMVFAQFHKSGTPLLFVLAGGYQTPIEEKLVPLHLNTFKAAFEEYCGGL
jgi:acetoin utilization deacetylase AcuC-like enzyme